MARSNEQKKPKQEEPPQSQGPEVKDPPSDLPDYTDLPEPTHPEDPVPPVIKSNNAAVDPNDNLNYIREPTDIWNRMQEDY